MNDYIRDQRHEDKDYAKELNTYTFSVKKYAINYKIIAQRGDLINFNPINCQK